MENTEIIYKIEYQSEAEADLKDIAFYYHQTAGTDIAKTNIERILNSIDGLEHIPYRCPVCDFSPNIRKLTVPKLPYLVFFKVVGDTVHILNIFNAKRNPRLLELKYQDQ
ncbi:type II toxin-antitoxin system RelE/ParE family toxin [Moraxella nonliquefaciens]|jgi:hypothetical protein|uniref:type II toxin-antitoxin system RelE/ParE family toxin n=1 Tax=Moraxella nonliquefaciens TaxID=478 RepID=UPI001EF5690F|nr:type II toxin-antitoxin system RelE/ParE family toxin [Moraxella nonliquefaciens]MCG7412883.1 type II toxin-antitoxin system RelE/ParE family toxin [Moraxella nonliquefaciens]